jgi:hypothetical protein
MRSGARTQARVVPFSNQRAYVDASPQVCKLASLQTCPLAYLQALSPENEEALCTKVIAVAPVLITGL